MLVRHTRFHSGPVDDPLNQLSESAARTRLVVRSRTMRTGFEEYNAQKI